MDTDTPTTEPEAMKAPDERPGRLHHVGAEPETDTATTRSGRGKGDRVEVSPAARALVEDVLRQVGAQRAAQEMPLAALAREAELDEKGLRTILSGNRQVTLPTLHRIADALGCDLLVTLKPRKARR